MRSSRIGWNCDRPDAGPRPLRPLVALLTDQLMFHQFTGGTNQSEGAVTSRQVDAIVVGGGIAGLASAWMLRHRDVLLLEADTRVGGRICSEPRGKYWLNWGAHVFAGPDSATGRLMQELGVHAEPGACWLGDERPAGRPGGQ
jgi:hypothetical protein